MAEDLPEEILLRPGVDRVFDILRTRQRRLILLMLGYGELETETDAIFRGSQDSETARLQLKHTHLPKLEKAGYIEWDPTTGEISKGPRFDEIKPFLDLIQDHADELPADWP